jgi:hypothetical protein
VACGVFCIHGLRRFPLRLHERYWQLCDVLEAAGYTPTEASRLAEAAVFPVPPAEDEVDLDEPCPDVSRPATPDQPTGDGWYSSEDYGKARVA